MPTTGGTYGLYGLVELPLPHRFGRWTVVLLLSLGILLWICIKCTPIHLKHEEKKLSKNRYLAFRAADTLEDIALLLVQRSGAHNPKVSVGTTLIGLQMMKGRTQHTQFLNTIERTLYDKSYDKKITYEEAKAYLLTHPFFNSLTTG